MAEQIAQGLYRLEIPLVGSPLKTLNSYLITGERNLLIDTGFREESCRTAIVAQLQECGVDMDKTDIFLTHVHTDHTGLSTDLIRPGCQIYISRVDGEVLTQRCTDAFWRMRYENMIREGFTRQEMEDLFGQNPAQDMAPLIYDGYAFLEDGDILHYGGRRLRCILTPGHSPGHMCLYDETEEILFSGDHILFHITPNITRWEEMPNALGTYLESLRALRDLPVKTLLPAHREKTGELRARTDELLSHHHRRLEDTLRTVRDMPGSTAYEIAGAMRWKIRCRSWEDFPLAQKFFAVGEALSHLDHLAVLGQVEEICKDGTMYWYPISSEKET